ncbi:MAG: hypothetical protein JW750_11395 [Anaerolineaceae bacterium]|nr:hypothetical protein [Anaerolineaceae bacterium]
MKKVLIATSKPFAPKAQEGIHQVLKDAGYEVAVLAGYVDPAALLAAIADVDAVIIRSDKITAEVLDAAKQLKIVVRAGAGYDNVDLAAARARGVVVENTPGQNSDAVAELALGMMVFQARNQFNGSSGTELKEKTLGIHAFGNVGSRVAKIAQGFGMKVYAFDPFVPAEAIEAAGVIPCASVEEMYAACQYVSLHIPAIPQTIGSINEALLKRMPEGAVLVNTARKEVIDEAGLLKVFADRADFQYVSDVAPDCAAEIASNYPGRFFFTPKKMGAQTEEANVNAGLAAACQIVNYFENGDTQFQVNRAK